MTVGAYNINPPNLSQPRTAWKSHRLLHQLLSGRECVHDQGRFRLGPHAARNIVTKVGGLCRGGHVNETWAVLPAANQVQRWPPTKATRRAHVQGMGAQPPACTRTRQVWHKLPQRHTRACMLCLCKRSCRPVRGAQLIHPSSSPSRLKMEELNDLEWLVT